MALPDPLTRLIEELVRLPGIGPKGAQRLAFHLRKTPRDVTDPPVGARRAKASSGAAAVIPASAPSIKSQSSGAGSALGLNGRQPNIVIQQSFTVSRPPAAVWEFFADIAAVVPCLPAASLTPPPAGMLL